MFPNTKIIKWIVIVFWISVVVLSGFFMWRYQISPEQIVELIQNLFTFLRASRLGYMLPVAFVVIFCMRPLLLIPTFAMNIVAFLVFGPIYGFFIVLLAEQMSALSLFLSVRYLASDQFKRRIMRTAHKMGLDTSETFMKQFAMTLVLRFASLPFDLVTTLCACSHIKLIPFQLGTVLVSIPWVIISFFAFASVQAGSWQETIMYVVVFIVFISIGWIIARKSNIINHSVSVADLDNF